MKILVIFLLPVLVFAQEKTFEEFIQKSTQELVRSSSLTHVAVAYGSLRSENEVYHFGESTASSYYDLASITKVFTALLFTLLEQDKIISRHNLLFKSPRVTYEDLLRHRAGLPIGVNFTSSETPLRVWNKIHRMKPKASLVGKFRYSDINFLLLGDAIAKVQNMDLDKIFSVKLFRPLKMNNTKFSLNLSNDSDCPRTSLNVKPCLVHDPTSFKLGSLTGHAGLFSSIDDLVILARELLQSLQSQGVLFNKKLIENILVKDQNGRFIGFDSESKYARRPTGNFNWSKNSFGHTGFTGTSFFIDPDKKEFLIILTNAVLKKSKSDTSKKKYFDYLEKTSLNFTRLQK